MYVGDQAFCRSCMSMPCSGEKVDSLGDLIALCGCSMKAIRTGPACEVNIFDDMMAYLKKKVMADSLPPPSTYGTHLGVLLLLM